MGVIVGGALLGAPEPTMLTKAVGGVVLGKSTIGWGLSWYNLTQALTNDCDDYDAPSSATRAAATLIAPGNQDALLFADAVDLGIDLMSGRPKIKTNYLDPTIIRDFDVIGKTFFNPGLITTFQATQAAQIVDQDITIILDR